MSLYTGIKEVRKHNEQQFITDFKRIYTFVVWSDRSGFYKVLKSDVWSMAKGRKIFYYLDDTLYVQRRNCMVIK